MSHKAVNNHGHTKDTLKSSKMKFHANTNEVPSLIIKTAGISLSNREEQLSAMPLEDKDKQGGNWVRSPKELQLVNQESTKIKKGWWKKNMQLFVSSYLRSDGGKKS